MFERMRALIAKNREIILYLCFGVATTLVNWVVYTVLVRLTGMMTLSNALAWLMAVIFAFAVNKLFVFESKHSGAFHLLKEIGSFFLGRMLSGGVEILLPTLLYRMGLTHTLLGIYGFFAKAVTSIIVIVLNYVFSKLIVFRKKEDK